MSADTLAATGIHLWRGERHVLRGVSFEVRAGEALHVAGPNGSGKTTLLRVVCGLLHPEDGYVSWNGMRLHSGDDELSGHLAYLGHENALKGDLTVSENLHFDIGLRHRLDPDELHSTLSAFDVARCADLPSRVLSAGQRRRVALCRVLLSGARVWVLDEPFTNLDAASSEYVSRMLERHVEQGGLALVAAHQGLGLNGERVRVLELT